MFSNRYSLKFLCIKVRAAVLDRYVQPAYDKARELPEEHQLKAIWDSVTPTAFRAWAGQTPANDFMKDKWADIQPIVDELESAGVPAKVRKLASSWDALSLASEVAKILYGKKNPEEPEPEESKEPEKSEESEDSDEPELTGGEEERDSADDSGEESDKEAEAGDEDSEGKETEKESEKPEESDEDGDDSSDESIDSEDGESTDEGDDKSESDSSEESGDSDEVGENGGSESHDEDSEVSDEPDTEEIEKAPIFTEDDIEDIAEDELKKLTEDAAESSHADSSYKPYTTDLDIVEPAPEGDRYYSDQSVSKIEEALKGDIGSMMRGLERAFEADNRSWWQPGKTRGRIHAANLSRLMSNDDRVFRAREVIKTKECAVSLVVDCSASMISRNRITTAAYTAFALSSVLEGLNISHEVIGFTTVKDYKVPDKELKEMIRKGYDYSRSEPLYMPIFKGFNERLGSSQKRRLGNLAVRADYLLQNIDGESLMIAARRLMAQREPGKTMIVLSDGDPCSARSNRRLLSNHLKETIDHLSRSINMIGIGIQTNTVDYYFPKSVVIDDVEAMPSIVLNELASAILAK